VVNISFKQMELRELYEFITAKFDGTECDPDSSGAENPMYHLSTALKKIRKGVRD
jgi:hypothetical protein